MRKAKDLDLVQQVLKYNDTMAVLQLFLAGQPVELLRPLLEHREDRVVKAGIWIASELGGKAGPLIPQWSDYLSIRLSLCAIMPSK